MKRKRAIATLLGMMMFGQLSVAAEETGGAVRETAWALAGTVPAFEVGKPKTSLVIILILVLILLLLIAILVLDFLSEKGIQVKPYGGAEKETKQGNTITIKPADLSQLKKQEPGFSPDHFLIWTEELFLDLISAKEMEQWEKLRPCVTDGFYQGWLEKQNGLKRQGVKAIFEQVKLERSLITKYQKKSPLEQINAAILCEMICYTEEAKTNRLINGSRYIPDKFYYELEFIRRDRETSKTGIQTLYCNHCGAPIQAGRQTRCDYCKSTVDIKECEGAIDWSLRKCIGRKIL